MCMQKKSAPGILKKIIKKKKAKRHQFALTTHSLHMRDSFFSNFMLTVLFSLEEKARNDRKGWEDGGGAKKKQLFYQNWSKLRMK